MSVAVFHLQLPIIISVSEDGSLKLWHSQTFKQEQTVNYNMERAWSLDINKSGCFLSIGYDEGTIVLKMGNDEPVFSHCQGKVIFAKNLEILQANLKAIGIDEL